MNLPTLNRRQLLAASAAACFDLGAQEPRKRVAAVVTMYTHDRSLYSHAAVIIGRLLEGYSPDGVFTRPRTRLVSMYTAQVPANDLSRGLSEKYGFKIYPTIKDALTLGGDDLAVDAVCFVGEHGNYPWNERGQHLYPRYELMEPIVEVFRVTGKTVPLFSDKHFSYSWSKAKQMYSWSRELNYPLMAGSSIPLTMRSPALEISYGAEIEHAVALGYGELDAYGFHTLEALQSMVERRKGGETGIRAVEWIEGDDVWKWRDGAGRWSIPLLEAALSRYPSRKPGRLEDNVKTPAVFVLEYRDGLQAAAYMLEGQVTAWSFAASLKGQSEPVSTLFLQGDEPGSRPFPHFDGLVHCMEEMFITGKPLYPVERTLLTTCTLSMLFESRAWRRRIESKELAISYRAPRNAYFQRA
ncbi:MAG TPA: hypothetical protein VMA31_15055 [Bryobacteraceae bacterium]|nr:hypothetical protein [Bryobacteraceae bacterium]